MSCALAFFFCVAHGILLTDIDSVVWTEYIQVLRIISWPLICAPPIMGTRWAIRSSTTIHSLTDRIGKPS
jgi:hypothetical protein